MKKLYLLAILGSLTAGNMFAMHNNYDSDNDTDIASQQTQEAPPNNAALEFNSDSDEENLVTTHEQYRQKTTQALTRNFYPSARSWFTKWTKVYERNQITRDGAEYFDFYQTCGNQIFNNARHNGQGSKSPFSAIPEKITAIQAKVNTYNNNNNNQNR